MVNVGALESA